MIAFSDTQPDPLRARAHEGSNSVAADQLRSYVERIGHLDGEIKALNGDKSDVFKEARANGFDVPALRVVIKQLAQDADKRSAHESMVELYREALGLA